MPAGAARAPVRAGRAAPPSWPSFRVDALVEHLAQRRTGAEQLAPDRPSRLPEHLSRLDRGQLPERHHLGFGCSATVSQVAKALANASAVASSALALLRVPPSRARNTGPLWFLKNNANPSDGSAATRHLKKTCPRSSLRDARTRSAVHVCPHPGPALSGDGRGRPTFDEANPSLTRRQQPLPESG